MSSELLGFDYDQLVTLLSQLDATTPVIPPVVISYFLDNSGCVIEDPLVLSMIELSIRTKIQKIIKLSRDYAISVNSTTINHNNDITAIVTQEHISYALEQYGIQPKAPMYFTIDDANRL
jgi:hypothetical protein